MPSVLAAVDVTAH